MYIQSLNGKWNYRIGKGKWENIDVPFSKLPVGHSECQLNFDLESNSDKIFLKFDGITYSAKITLNGTFLGEMYPYTEYEYDVTKIVKNTANELLVELEDISPVFGPTEGWENFGGIIRDVSVLYKNSNYIEDVFFHSKLLNNYSDAEFVVETKAFDNSNAEFEITLSYNDEAVISYTQKGGEIITENINSVRLWSPDSPNLYKLDVKLFEKHKEVDTYTCNVGFREISCERHRFLVNGKPLFFKGVCKHEMIGDSGHCPTFEQMEADMKMLKGMGCNFVRLVHYPHNKKILDIADRIGLMVSEEPGLWWSETGNPEVSKGSLEVLKRTIYRDRNHASIVFWLCFNECMFTEKFLVDSAKLCKQCDPSRMVSGANCMTDEETLKYYNICGFDFYTMHPYSDTMERAKTSAKILNDKPLLFTEWGGYFVYNNPHLLMDFMTDMHNMYLSNSDESSLAGAFFWFWAELNDYNRGEPACTDGNLFEGLVDRYRKPTMIFDTFVKGLNLSDNADKTADFWHYTDEAYESFDGCKKLKAGEGKNYDDVFKKVSDFEKNHNGTMRHRELTVGPRILNIGNLDNTPVIVADGNCVEFLGDAKGNTLKIAGLTSLTKGYPISGEYGEEVAQIAINYTDGTNEIMTLKNGVDITTAFKLNMSSEINPVAENAKRLITFGYDKNFEVYVANIKDINLNENKALKNVTIQSKNNGYTLLIYGLFVG